MVLLYFTNEEAEMQRGMSYLPRITCSRWGTPIRVCAIVPHCPLRTFPSESETQVPVKVCPEEVRAVAYIQSLLWKQLRYSQSFPPCAAFTFLE